MRGLLESEASASAASSLLGGLRILAYHAVPDAGPFHEQIGYLVERYRPVGGDAVVRALSGGPPLPQRAVWVTFDDGYADVIENAQPVLDSHGLRASLFICPARVADSAPYWWHVTAEAERRGAYVVVDGKEWGGQGLTADLKLVPDEVRRRVVTRLQEDLSVIPSPTIADVSQIRTWLAAGHELGNHTWDHPCLDRCDTGEQARQIHQAHRWFTDTLGIAPHLFAYPNGNWAQAAERELIELGYKIGLGFDHRRARTSGSGLRLSRLRVDSSLPVPRFRSIVSGVHPLVYRTRRLLKPVPAERPRALP